MRTVVDIIKALEGFPRTAPVQIGLVGTDGGRVLHDIHAVEAHESGVVLLVESHTSAKASAARTVEADQPGEAIAAPFPPAVPGGLEGEVEDPEPPRTETGRPGDKV